MQYCDNLSEILHLEGRDRTVRIHYNKTNGVCHIGRVFGLVAVRRPALVLLGEIGWSVNRTAHVR